MVQGLGSWAFVDFLKNLSHVLITSLSHQMSHPKTPGLAGGLEAFCPADRLTVETAEGSQGFVTERSHA